MKGKSIGQGLRSAGQYIYQEGTVYIILVALVIFFSIFNPNFLSGQNIYNLITQSTYIIICGMGICFVMISGGIDLSVGYQMAVCGCLSGIIGGISMKGGKGNVVGMVAGILVMQMIANGMQLAGWGSYTQYTVKGIILMLAIAFDALKNRPKAAVRVRKETGKAGAA